MVPLIANNISAIRDVCKKHHVKSLYLIGSAARGTLQATSDVDFLYRFNKNEIAELEYADNYFELLFELENILSRKVDLVAQDKMRNPYFIDSINKDKQVVYES